MFPGSEELFADLRPLPVVYAYHDSGPVIQEATRWSPRVVACTDTAGHGDAPGHDYAVKYRQGRDGAAAVISEVVCHALLRALGLRTLEAALVSVSADLANAYAQAALVDYTIETGYHFGTVLRRDLNPGPPENWEQLADPRELIQIWAADCWLMNLDRNTYGNLLMELDQPGKWHLIAADQSDCFLGAASLADGSYFTREPGHGAAPFVSYVERALLECGCEALYLMIERIRRVSGIVPDAVGLVPNAWWSQAGMIRDDLIVCLRRRADRMRTILDVEKWEGLRDVTGGGRSLGV